MARKTMTSVGDTVRAFNKHVLNPAMLLLAGRKQWYANVIRNKGRRSGTEYATPVVAERISHDTFIVPLPYGSGVGWLRNVQAANQATMTINGQTSDVRDPQVIEVAAAALQISARRQRTFQLFGIDSLVKLTIVK
jgi:hypothetical protein